MMPQRMKIGGRRYIGLAAIILTATSIWHSSAANAQSANDSRVAVSDLKARGVWSAATNYVTDDIVTSRGSTWRAKRASKGKIPGATSPSTAADWEVLAVGFNPLGAWSNAPTYQLNDIVTHLGSTWRAKLTNHAVTPGGSAANWEQFVAKGAAGANGSDGAAGTPGSNGADGAPGADGSNGAQGNPGQPGSTGPTGPSGVVQTLVLSSIVSGFSIAGNSSDFVFAGDTGTVTLDGNQRLTGTASLPIYSPASSNFQQTLCYRVSDDSAPIATFMGGFQGSSTVGNAYVLFTASGSVIPPAGTYKVGYCVKNPTIYTYSTDWVQGWVMVTTEQ
jgi:hypothetical protein